MIRNYMFPFYLCKLVGLKWIKYGGWLMTCVPVPIGSDRVLCSILMFNTGLVGSIQVGWNSQPNNWTWQSQSKSTLCSNNVYMIYFPPIQQKEPAIPFHTVTILWMQVRDWDFTSLIGHYCISETDIRKTKESVNCGQRSIEFNSSKANCLPSS